MKCAKMLKSVFWFRNQTFIHVSAQSLTCGVCSGKIRRRFICVSRRSANVREAAKQAVNEAVDEAVKEAVKEAAKDPKGGEGAAHLLVRKIDNRWELVVVVVAKRT